MTKKIDIDVVESIIRSFKNSELKLQKKIHRLEINLKLIEKGSKYRIQ